MTEIARIFDLFQDLFRDMISFGIIYEAMAFLFVGIHVHLFFWGKKKKQLLKVERPNEKTSKRYFMLTP